MPVVILIRHAENDYVKKGRLAGRLPGVHLNTKGEIQASKLADLLKNAPIKAIYSSPLERASETAQPLAAAHNLTVFYRDALQEMDIGEWQDQPLKSLRRNKKMWGIIQQSPSLFRFPGGESFAEAQQRITAELLTLSASYTQKDVIACISHADPIKLAAAYFIGLPLDSFQRLHVSPASLTTLVISERGASLLSLNVDYFLSFPKG